MSTSDVLTLNDLTPVSGVELAARVAEAGRSLIRSGGRRPKKIKPFIADFIELLEGRRAGHMGKWEYSNGGMKIWADFLATYEPYYVPRDDRAIIEQCASVSANILNHSDIKKVTLVCRGPGTQFDAKEGALIRAFQVAGIEVAKVVYIDVSASALNQSVKEGKALLPSAEHQKIQADIFDPETKHQYDVVGTEIGTCFGLTPMNAEGRNDADKPTTSIEANLSGIRGQMKKGSHFIATYDHNDDGEQIEAAYAGQTDFAKHMLAHHLGWKNGMDDIDFLVEFNETSRILAHGFRFNEERTFEVGDRLRTIPAGTTLWFNNSVKLGKDETEACHEHAGFDYLLKERAILAANQRHGYHHTIAA